MALVTFISDFGDKDHYVASVKARMLSINPQLNIVDISHSVSKFDIEHAAFILRNTFREFPKGTVHLVGVKTTGRTNDGFIGVKLEDHFFIGPNNGMLSLLSEKDPDIIVHISETHVKSTTFPTRDILAAITAKVASGVSIQDFGGPCTRFKKSIIRQAKATKEQLVGQVIRIDGYGNAITNIRRDVFERLNPGKFTIHFAREKLEKLQTGYDQVDEGDPFVFFNSLDLMEIGINYDNASSLLGLKKDSVVYVNFFS
jgi:S-adenosylmethionine hydrolase